MLERLFKFRENGTTLGRDTLAGLTTFIVMSYIIFVNPSILGFQGVPALQKFGLPFAAALTATCLVAGVMTLLMGVVTNKAFAIAPGMGLNAVVAFQLVATEGLTMKSAMGLILMPFSSEHRKATGLTGAYVWGNSANFYADNTVMNIGQALLAPQAIGAGVRPNGNTALTV